MTAQIERVAPILADEDSAKRRQIIEGARRVFLAQGFDAASMGEIARAAGVSKGTLYVYFENKEQLFEAIVGQECRAQAEGIFKFDPADHDVDAVLTRLGVAYVEFLCRPGGPSSLQRTVIAIAERMPEVGRLFYETGPAHGIDLLASYLSAQVAARVLAVEDCEIAAAQFMDACQSTLFKPVLFNFGATPTPERIKHVVKIAVRAFLAAYRAR
ncbi:MAG TPA: TetR/AcrR family transcriptional regulator [Xanthobacteraceae bacterium]|jgi:AcrR family transcriptional regulator|nr:TetR/AcrR family transcriptional regulator [Xanthobacteraceae bacterium]